MSQGIANLPAKKDAGLLLLPAPRRRPKSGKEFMDVLRDSAPAPSTKKSIEPPPTKKSNQLKPERTEPKKLDGAPNPENADQGAPEKIDDQASLEPTDDATDASPVEPNPDEQGDEVKDESPDDANAAAAEQLLLAQANRTPLQAVQTAPASDGIVADASAAKPSAPVKPMAAKPAETSDADSPTTDQALPQVLDESLVGEETHGDQSNDQPHDDPAASDALDISGLGEELATNVRHVAKKIESANSSETATSNPSLEAADEVLEAESKPQPASHAAASVSSTDSALQGISPDLVGGKAPVVISNAPAAPTSQNPAQSMDDVMSNNHDRIVSSVRTQLLPDGGTMHLRLDPPELGVLQVTVRMNDGVMSASFETQNEQAARLLSHSLGQLKTVLESQGINVEKLHVQQSPRNEQGSTNSDDQGDQRRQGHGEDSLARREQERREMLNRMWRRLRLGNDPLDMVA